MANYTVTDYVTAPKNTVVEITALLEAKLDILDSTSNPIRGIGIVPMGDMFVGWVIYD